MSLKLVVIRTFLLCIAFNTAHATQDESTSSSPKKYVVDRYLTTYRNVFQDLYTKDIPAHRMEVGSARVFQSNRYGELMLETLDLILSGALDECCYTDSPTQDPSLPVATWDEIIHGATIDNPAGGTIDIRDNLGAQLDNLDSEMRKGFSAWNEIPDSFDDHAYQLMGYIVAGTDDDRLMGRLKWNFLYYNNPNLLTEFKFYYVYACVVCYGQGFYDTSKMEDINPATGNTWSEDLITEENFPRSYGFIVDMVDPAQGQPGEHAPLQASIGITMQGQWRNSEGTLDPLRIYPMHCHQASELYIMIDPIGLSKVLHSPIFEGTFPYTLDTKTYAAGTPNNDDRTPVPMPDMSSQYPSEYSGMEHGDLVYNHWLKYHSFAPGERLQFMQWARLSYPKEGTYFPLNGGPNPPGGLQCFR